MMMPIRRGKCLQHSRLQATFASKLEIVASEAHVTREVDGGLMTLAVTLPAVVTTDLRLNEPRYAKLPDIMKARSKPMTIIAADSLGCRWIGAHRFFALRSRRSVVAV